MKKKTFFILQLFIFILSGLGVWGYAYYRGFTGQIHTLDIANLSTGNSSAAVPGLPNDFYTFNVDVKPNPTKAAAPSLATGNHDSSSSPAPQSQPTQQTIYSLYVPAFEQLQEDADERIDQLTATALADYRTSKQTGSPTIPELINKYATAGKKLQSGVDQAFYQLLARMKKDLQSAGLPLDLVNLAEQEYKARIQLKKDELIAKAKSHF